MALSRKLILAFASAFAVAAIVVSFCLFQMRRLQTHTFEFVKVAENVTAITQVAGLGPNAQKMIQAAVLTDDLDQIEAEWFSDVKGSSTGQLEDLKKITTADTQEFYQTIESSFRSMCEIFESQLLPLLKNKTTKDPIKIKQIVTELNQKATALGDAALRFRNLLAGKSEEEKTSLEKLFRISLFISLGTVAITFTLGALLAFRITRSISGPLEATIETLTRQAAETHSISQTITSASQQLSQSAATQADAIQQTSSAIEQMSSMIEKSAESANSSGEAASKSARVASDGKIASDQTLAAITEISQSNAAIMTAVNESNERITEITRVIAEIGNKTKVINDIVFQTKLLSFNASVEAARAGEHGKGFAVVAEEVGNLAQMSGNASREISQLLEGSIRKVQSIVEETKSRVGTLVSDGKSKVDLGSAKAHDSQQMLERIAEEAGTVHAMVKEISAAAREQAQGVTDIKKAVSQIDSMMHQTSTMSGEVASSATSLAGHAQSLNEIVSSLKALVWGENDSSSRSTNA